MTETERRKIEKSLIKAIENEQVGTDAHKKALQELLDFQKQQEEIRNNLQNQEIDLQKLEVDRKKIESQETVAKCQRDVDEERLRQEKEIADEQRRTEKEKMRVEKLAARWNFIGSILQIVGGILSGVITTAVGYKFFGIEAEKSRKFEMGEMYSSFTSKQTMSGLKPPKH